jgi:hypothetical protein
MPTQSGTRTGGTLEDLARAGLLQADIFATYKGKRYEATREGANELRLADGTAFGSLSQAGKHITGGAVNGWTFWKTEHDGTTVPLSKLRALLFSAVEAYVVSREGPRPRKRHQEFLDAFNGSMPAGNVEKAPDVHTCIGVIEGLLAREVTLRRV